MEVGMKKTAQKVRDLERQKLLRSLKRGLLKLQKEHGEKALFTIIRWLIPLVETPENVSFIKITNGPIGIFMRSATSKIMNFSRGGAETKQLFYMLLMSIIQTLQKKNLIILRGFEFSHTRQYLNVRFPTDEVEA